MNSTAKYRFTIIVPVYNEEENIYTLEEKLKQFLPHAILSACVLFVNDGSKDDSLPRIEEICSRNSHFFYLSLDRNGGLSAALKAGIDFCFSEYVGYMDADLQTDPDDFNLLLRDICNYEMVTGIRANRKDSFFKNLQSKIANGYRRMMTNDGVADTGCPLKVMQTDVAKRYPFFQRDAPFLACIDSASKREGEADTRASLSTCGRHIEILSLEQVLPGPFIRLFPLYRWIEKKIHQLSRE